MGTNPEPVKAGDADAVLPLEELALKEQLATIDDSVDLEELLAELDDDLKAEGARL